MVLVWGGWKRGEQARYELFQTHHCTERHILLMFDDKLSLLIRRREAAGRGGASNYNSASGTDGSRRGGCVGWGTTGGGMVAAYMWSCKGIRNDKCGSGRQKGIRI